MAASTLGESMVSKCSCSGAKNQFGRRSKIQYVCRNC